MVNAFDLLVVASEETERGGGEGGGGEGSQLDKIGSR